MARISATEDVEGIRDEQDIGDSVQQEESASLEATGPADQETVILPDASGSDEQKSTPPEDGGSVAPEDKHAQSTASPSKFTKRRHVATLPEVHDAFDSVNVLRYSQPCHLQGKSTFYYELINSTEVFARKMPGSHHCPVQRRSHTRRDNMEDTFSNRWYHALCRGHEPHARAAP